MSVSRLQVTYKSPEIDEELDKKILDFFNSLDFICIDRAYMSMDFRRDIFFEKHSGDFTIEGAIYESSGSQKAKLKT